MLEMYEIIKNLYTSLKKLIKNCCLFLGIIIIKKYYEYYLFCLSQN